MKKLAAVTMCLAMLLSAGCRKTDETTSERKKNSTKTERSEKTEKAESSEDISDTSASSATTTPSAADAHVFARDLERLPVNLKRVSDTFYPRELTEEDFVVEKNLLGEDVERCLVPGVSYYYDYIRIEDPAYRDVEAQLESALKPYIDELLSSYNDEVERLKALDPSEYGEGGQKALNLPVRVLRADTEIIVYEIKGKAYSYSVELGRNMKVSDIAKDMQKFEDFFMIGVRNSINDYALSPEQVDALYEEIHEKFLDETIRFTMDYDTVTFHLDCSNKSGLIFTELAYAVYGNYPYFNLGWFGHTPEYYALHAVDFIDTVKIWDCNGDGVEEDMILKRSEKVVDGKYPAELVLGGKRLELQLDYNRGMYSIVRTDDGMYCYLANCCVRIEDDGSMTLVREDSPEFCMLKSWQDPEHFTVTEAMELLGLRDMCREYTLLGNNGAPRALTPYYSVEESKLVSKAELRASRFDADAGTEEEEIVIPAGAVYDIKEYDPDEGTMLFLVKEKSESGDGKEYFAKVDVEFQDAEDGSQKKVLILSGVPESELF